MLNEKFYLGQWYVDSSLNQIENQQQLIHLAPKQMQLLLVLANQCGEVVTREVLAEVVWPERPVSDHVISRTVASLRKALGDEAKKPIYIATIPKVGYRLIETPKEQSQLHNNRQLVEKPSKGIGHYWMLSLVALIAVVGLIYSFWPEQQTTAFYQSKQIRPVETPRGVQRSITLSADGKGLLFEQWDNSGGADLVLTRADLDKPARLFTTPGYEFTPAWSPDGSEIAFGRIAEDGGCSIEVMSASGGPSETITRCGPVPAPIDWSPDGRWIGFADIHSEKLQIYRIYQVSRDGRQRKLLIDNNEPGISIWAPRYSPDGQYVAFIRGSMLHTQLMLANADGTQVRNLQVGGFGSIFGFDWQADGQALIYSYPSEFGTYTLWQIDIAPGSKPRRLFDIELGYIHLVSPSISGETGRFAYIQWEREDSFWSIDIQQSTSRLTRLENFTGFDKQPAWSNQGHYLAYISRRNGRSEIRYTDTDLQSHQVLAGSEQGQIYAFTWSPDDTKLAYLEYLQGKSYLRMISLDDLELQTIFETDFRLAGLAWVNGHFYLSSDQGGLWKLYRFDALQQRLVPLGDNEVFSFKPTPDGASFYYMKAEQDGLWKLDAETGLSELQIENFRWEWRLRWGVDERGLLLPCLPSSGFKGLCRQGFDGSSELVHALEGRLLVSGITHSKSGKIIVSMIDSIESTIMATPEH